MTEHEAVTVMAPAVYDGPPAVQIPALIPLRARDGSTRAYALVDEDDFDRLSSVSWYLLKIGYAVRTEVVDGRKRMLYMHRVLLDAPKGLDVDHINGIRIDNRRANLRIVTHRENTGNQSTRSRLTGVHKHPGKDRWFAQTRVGAPEGKRRAWLGTFDSEAEAADAVAAHLSRHDPRVYVDLLEAP